MINLLDVKRSYTVKKNSENLTTHPQAWRKNWKFLLEPMILRIICYFFNGANWKHLPASTPFHLYNWNPSWPSNGSCNFTSRPSLYLHPQQISHQETRLIHMVVFGYHIILRYRVNLDYHHVCLIVFFNLDATSLYLMGYDVVFIIDMP